MNIVNMHQAKTQLSKLVELASKGESFVIARAGKPLVKVVAIDAPDPQPIKRLGFLKGELVVPDDFDDMARDTIEHLFYGDQ
ncbi:type II toxin-antitoxin system Phd/YefM family antitoxin [Allohahella sp. A8]|uniref:type II toxin-antitoxin system Phd/YefM family antitoxin n=1 Tax=Allohahella sp. A8 TaxID=3141461 RepID=UPI003A80D876